MKKNDKTNKNIVSGDVSALHNDLKYLHIYEDKISGDIRNIPNLIINKAKIYLLVYDYLYPEIYENCISPYRKELILIAYHNENNSLDSEKILKEIELKIKNYVESKQ